jgi:hypothetical protein
VVIGVAEPVDPTLAPVARTAAERLIFAQLYQTLVTVACRGEVTGSLAASWTSSSDGRLWTFNLRPEARDWFGEPITASSVDASWRRALALTRDGGVAAGATLSTLDQIAVVDPQTLVVTLTRPVSVDFFADPALAVANAVGGDGWPVGSGAFRPGPGGIPSPTASPPQRFAGPVTLEARSISGDPRDALDRGVDVLVTNDRAVIDYAEASPAFEALPLAWDRSYVLLAPAAAPLMDPLGEPMPRPGFAPLVRSSPPEALDALARDAVRVEARAAALPDARCTFAQSSVSTGAGGRAPRVVYPASDAVAGALAERLVALAIGPARPDSYWLSQRVPELITADGRPSAVGLAGAEFDQALRAGRDAAYVFAVAATPHLASCEPLSAAVARAPWLLAPPTSNQGWRPAVLPLVDARSTVVVRRGVAGLEVDGAVLRLDRVRRVSSEAPR